MIHLAHVYLTLLLVAWIALFAPMVCEYHGVMLHENLGHGHSDVLQSAPHTADHYAHGFASSMTLVMNLLLAVLPQDTVFSARVLSQTFPLESFRFPRQPGEPPPRQPPRL